MKKRLLLLVIALILVTPLFAYLDEPESSFTLSLSYRSLLSDENNFSLMGTAYYDRDEFVKLGLHADFSKMFAATVGYGLYFTDNFLVETGFSAGEPIIKKSPLKHYVAGYAGFGIPQYTNYGEIITPKCLAKLEYEMFKTKTPSELVSLYITPGLEYKGEHLFVGIAADIFVWGQEEVTVSSVTKNHTLSFNDMQNPVRLELTVGYTF